MNLRKIIFAALLVSAFAGCKKDEDTTVSPSLEGYLTIKGLPAYVSGKQSVQLEPKGLSHPEGKEIPYTWRVSPTAPAADSTRIFNFTFSDTLQTCTITCTASAEGYSSSAAVGYTTYYYKQIGTQTWLLNNVAEKPSGMPYVNADVMSNVFGRYYSYQDAISVCESLSTSEMEWTLPTLEDWRTLQTYIKGQPDAGKSVAAALMGNASFNGETMWEYWKAVGDITNSTGFSAIPVGYTNIKSSLFDGEYEYAAFWTASPADKSNEAKAVYIIENQPDIYIGDMDRESFGASVRCIRK